MSNLPRDNKTFFGIEDDTWTALAIWAIIGLRGFNANINHLMYYFIDKLVSWDSFIVVSIISCFMVIGTATAIKKMKRRETLLVGLVVLLYFLSFLLSENARRILKGTYFSTVIIYGVCGIICISRFTNWEKFIKVSMPMTIIGNISFFTLAILALSGKLVVGYMNFSYYNLIFVISSLWLAIHKKNIIMWIAGIAGVIILIFTGCRGALMCALIYVLLEFLLSKKMKPLAKVGFFAAITLLYFNLENIMLWLDGNIKELGYSSRTIDKFFEGTLQDDSGREMIFGHAMDLARERPLLGYGMGGSSIPLFERVNGYAAEIGQGVYSHNLFIELILHFGFFLGGAMCICLIIYTIRAFIKGRTANNYNVIFLMFSLTIPKLMISSVYLAEPDFFVFLGLLLNLCSRAYQTNEHQLSRNFNV